MIAPWMPSLATAISAPMSASAATPPEAITGTRVARALTTPVIASGGVSSLADLERLKPHEADGIIGVISGRAIYDGRLDLKTALEYLRS